MRSVSTFIVLMAVLVFSGCSKSDPGGSTEPPPMSTMFDINKATLVKQGSFTGNMNYKVSGTVRLYNYEGANYIYFENFSSNSGPDLKVYIATSSNASQFVSLGTLKSTAGTQVYLITGSPDFALYNKVLIWCQQFSVLFGESVLQ